MGLPSVPSSAARDWLGSTELMTLVTAPLVPITVSFGLLALNSNTAFAPGDVVRVSGVQAVTTKVPAVLLTEVAVWSRTSGI